MNKHKGSYNMMIMESHIVLCLLLLLFCMPIALCSNQTCIAREREALLQFKASLDDPFGSLSSWSHDEDCSSWQGVLCSKRNGHVVHLDLHDAYLSGEINQSLLSLKHLNYLDLSSNGFGGIPIPAFIGSMKRLKHLDLFRAGFGSEVPRQLGNLSRLQYLNLSGNVGAHIKSDQWLSRLSLLEYLDLTFIEVRSSSTFLQSVSVMPSLLGLHLRNCSIHTLPSILHFNSTSLRVLDLSSNIINSTLPLWLFELKSLEHLDLSYNSFDDLIPTAIGNLTSLNILLIQYSTQGTIRIPSNRGNLCSLKELTLSGNSIPCNFHELREAFSGCIRGSLDTLSWSSSYLEGHLPEWLGMLENLKNLDLSYNELNGTLPKSLWQLQKLEYLSLRNNFLQGELVEAHFAGFPRLVGFDVSSNNLSLSVASVWSPPPLLRSFGLGSCNLGPQFPTWLQKMKNLESINLSQNKISSVIPDWFWNFSTALEDIDLSKNGIKGQLPRSLERLNVTDFNFRDNNLKGPLPLFSSRVSYLDLSDNSFSGFIPLKFWKKAYSLSDLFLQGNNLSGSIHRSICELQFLISFDLSKNHLSGEIPDSWNNSLILFSLNLGNNHMSGSIPKSIGALSYLRLLDISNNNLSGELPFLNCNNLVALDLGHNKLSGNIPIWIGEKLKNLTILRLTSNMLTGAIPDGLGTLASLRVMDLAHNNLSGEIPHMFGNLTGIRIANEYYPVIAYYNSPFVSVMLDFRGREDEYFNAPTTINLACNNLYGVIPEEILTLHGLKNLNLSGNHLSGKIPENIGMMRQLESFDLSFNRLFGPIPTSMIGLSFLSHLNLSFNDLSGQIPYGGQLQALPYPSIYFGNKDLCGLPLDVKCHDNNGGTQTNGDGENQQNESDMVWFYTSMAPGFVVGFWTICGTLMLNRRCRTSYFRVADDVSDWLYVVVGINCNRISRWWSG